MTESPNQRRWWQRRSTSPTVVKENPVAGVTIAALGNRAVYSTTNAAAYAREGYLGNPDVRSAIEILATATAGVDWKTVRDDPRLDEGVVEVDAEHPLALLWHRPNPRMSRQALIGDIVRWRRIAGEAYIIAAGPSGKPPMELWIGRPDRMTIIPGTAADPVAGYEYTVRGTKQRLEADRVLHLPMFNPEDDLYGASPLRSTAHYIDQAAAAVEQNLGLMQNGGLPPMFLESSDDLTDTQFEQLREDMNTWGLAHRQGKPELLPAGLKVTSQAQTPRDMQYIEAARLHALKQAQIMGVPSEFLSGAGEKKYSNFSEAQRALFLFAVLPELDYLQGELNAWLSPLFDGVRLEYCVDDIEALHEDRDVVQRRAVDAWNAGLIMQNEARQHLGFDAIDGGDVFKPSSMGFDDGMGGEPSPDDGEGDQPGSDDERVKAFGLQTREDRAAYWKLVDSRRAKLEAGERKRIATLLDAERAAVVAAVKRGDDPSFDEDAWATTLTGLYRRVGKTFAEATLADLEKQTTPSRVKADGWQSYVDAYAKRTTGGKVTQITDTTRKEIKFVIDQGIEEGLSIPDIASMVDRLYMDQIIPNRSTVIARTETIAASNAGSMGAALSTGLPLEKEWIATSDDRTRSAHADMDGVTTPMDEPFDVDGDQLDFPGDGSYGADPSNVIQCRCTQAYTVIDE